MRRLGVAVWSLALLAWACSTPAPAAQPSSAASPVAEQQISASPERGKALATEYACAACHSPEGNVSVGPTWKGLYGKEETLTGGVKVKVDEAYLRESIVAPNAKVVEGFQPGIMPQDFGQKLSDEEIRALIAYVRALQ